MERAEAILLRVFGCESGLWRIERSPEGRRKASFVASNSVETVFLALGVDAGPLERLAYLGVAPSLIAHGVFDTEPFVVQRFIDGVHPDRAWLSKHVDQVGHLVRRYHADDHLTRMLDHEQASGAPYFRRETTRLMSRLQHVSWVRSPSLRLSAALQQFLADAATLEPDGLVPVHDEPNTSNMLVSQDSLVFVDWDGVRLGDPFRDLGPLMWWYLPEEQWTEILQLQDMELTGERPRKVYWFAARASLEVALWHMEHGSPDDHGFLDDFVAASLQMSNPRA